MMSSKKIKNGIDHAKVETLVVNVIVFCGRITTSITVLYIALNKT
jgi:hypothetical protein